MKKVLAITNNREKGMTDSKIPNAKKELRIWHGRKQDHYHVYTYDYCTDAGDHWRCLNSNCLYIVEK